MLRPLLPQEAFLLYDQRGDGKIPVSQIGDVMRALGQVTTLTLPALAQIGVQLMVGTSGPGLGLPIWDIFKGS